MSGREDFFGASELGEGGETRAPPAEQYVVTPKQVEESEEAPEEGFAATVNTKVEKQTVARGGYEKRPATRRGQQKSHSKVAGQPPRAAIELPKNMREGEGAESKETSADLFETEDYIVPNFGAELLAAASEEGRTMDYLVDVEEGERTLINRRDHNYAAFYERFKQAVANHWSPAKVYRRRDPTGKIYGVDDRLTVLSVTLSGDGEIKEIYVDESCGLSFLDDEALRAMKAAAPFPNPPEGLKGLDGTMKIKFGFMLTISTGSFKLFRYR